MEFKYTGPTGIPLMERHDHIRAWLRQALDEGRIVADPRGRTTTADLYDLYQSMHLRDGKDYMTKQMLGAYLTIDFNIRAIRGTGGTWYRGGIRIIPAS